MNELVRTQTQLPAKIDELSKFILVGTEKLCAVKAEIRAINKLDLAKDVMEQKRDECLMLSDALLDAQVKMGEFTKEIPTRKGTRTDIQPSCPEETKLRKTKEEAINSLGFSKKQVHQFETLANNKDLVEQVKAEARENDDIPTRSRVLELAKARKKKEEQVDNYDEYLNSCKKASYEFHDTLYSIGRLEVGLDKLSQWKELLGKNAIDDYLSLIENSIPKLLTIQKYLKEMKR